ncbi:hypothetical protein TSMG0116 [Halocynthia phage JM-2012]|uniref:virion structural protein n=1 Tax=Halocynthia phage JM-2012 TaxID=1173297 RepID=UPI00025C6948|nr:virion structural protein [Halocynthia phage JM-2012]AFI55399.1 hypothetical protein TSMG0116 [Halocynthia phage JM-2012]
MSGQLYNPPEYSHNTWRKEQLYTDPNSANGIVSGGVVPNVNDTVISWSGNIKIEERVVYVDPLTSLSTLEPVELPNNGNSAMVGIEAGIGNLSNVANLIMNPIDSKLSAVIDSRLPIYGSDLSYVRVFEGTDISENGKVISVRYDSNGQIIDDKALMVKADTVDNTLLRYVARPFNLTYTLPEDTLVVAVFYSDAGRVLMWQELVIKHSHIIANVHREALFINNVVLESAYQSPTNPNELLIPKNLLNASFSPRIFKEYQSGQREEMFIGTSNVTLAGWGDYVTGEVGEKFPLVLSYILGSGELSQNVDSYTGVHITNHYSVSVIDGDTETEVKIFVVPTFRNSSYGYELNYYLYTGGRNSAIDVTDSVNASEFNGLFYGAKQQIDFSLDLSQYVGLPDTVFADSIDVQLMGQPLANATMYRLWYWRDDERFYGENLRAKIVTNFGTNTISLNNFIGQFSEWIDKLYYSLSPLYDASISTEAPVPTHVDITVGGTTITMDVSTYWNGELNWNGTVPASGSNVLLEWYMYGENNNRLDLAISNMPLEVI